MRDISIEQYAQMKDTVEYDVVLRNLLPENFFAGKTVSIIDLPYSTVAYCFTLVQDMNTWEKVVELFTTIYEINEKVFWNEKIRLYFSAMNYIKETFISISKREQELLYSSNTDSSLWERAGGARLKPFASISPIDDLAERYGMYPFDLSEKKYKDIIYLLSLVKTKNEVTKEYQNLKQKK